MKADLNQAKAIRQNGEDMPDVHDRIGSNA